MLFVTTRFYTIIYKNFGLDLKIKQAHKVCVGQNELVMSLLEDFGLDLTLK
jgi:hypothetical protein